MKGRRHRRILDVIQNEVIETQDELAEALRRQGIMVTQATVSRDIKELRLVKVLDNGRYRYALPQDQVLAHNEERMRKMFRDAVTNLEYSENLIVVKTLPGTASAVASTIDTARKKEIIGTVAGDDTILIIVKPKEAVENIMSLFASILA